MKNMKVLFVTSGAIAYDVSSGNTFLNLFGELADTELYSLFTRSEVPDKKIKAAFRIAEAELPRYIFRRNRIGERVTASDCVLDEYAMQLEAVAEAQKHKPGLVLADIQLADNSSGIEAVQEILQGVKLPVIFITAFPERLLTGDRPEPAFLLTKPYQPATLRAAISQVLFFDESTVPA